MSSLVCERGEETREGRKSITERRESGTNGENEIQRNENDKRGIKRRG